MPVEKDTSIETRFTAALDRITEIHGCAPFEITRTQYFAYRKNTEPTEWELRQRGGYSQLLSLFYPKSSNLLHTSASQHIRSHKRKLDRIYGDASFFGNEFLRALDEKLKHTPIRLIAPVKTVKTSSASTTDRCIVALLSDTHYGANIDSREMGSINEFNWQVASRRTALFFDQIASYKPHYRDRTNLIICLNGDIIAGIIHDQEWFVDLITTQITGTIHILSQGFSWLASKFKNIEIICSPGNHGRVMHKREKGRAHTHKWDNFETIIYSALKTILESRYKNIKVTIPQSPYAKFDVMGNMFMQTHGDTVIDVGSPGRALNIARINNQINKLNASGVTDKKLSGIILGHVHTPTIQLMESGCALLINGCLSGIDPYAKSIGIFSNHPTQMLFESTKDYAVGDVRLIHVDQIDSYTGLDKIIAPFNGVF